MDSRSPASTELAATIEAAVKKAIAAGIDPYEILELFGALAGWMIGTGNVPEAMASGLGHMVGSAVQAMLVKKAKVN